MTQVKIISMGDVVGNIQYLSKVWRYQLIQMFIVAAISEVGNSNELILCSIGNSGSSILWRFS
jgi:hypothetical protein